MPETPSPCSTEKGLLSIVKRLDSSHLSKYLEFGVYSMEKLVCTLKRLDLSPLSKYMEFGVYSIEKLNAARCLSSRCPVPTKVLLFHVISFITTGSGVSIYAVIPALLYAGIQVIQKQILSFHQNKNKNKMNGLLFCRYMQGIALHIYGFFPTPVLSGKEYHPIFDRKTLHYIMSFLRIPGKYLNFYIMEINSHGDEGGGFHKREAARINFLSTVILLAQRPFILKMCYDKVMFLD